MRRSLSYIKLLTLASLLTAFVASPAKGEEIDEVALSLGLTGDEPVATSPFPRPISKIAENLTVITAQDIARLNAHTVADVLQTVPGIQLDQVQTPGSAGFFTILSMSSRHILVQLDGVPLNFISADNISEIGNIPVQMVERIEVIKGAASAAWGSALGGVINITTKSPVADRQIGGAASASAGEHLTTDLRAEISGTVNRFGYYLTGGNLHSNGLVQGNAVNLKHGFGKVSFDLPKAGKATLGVEFRENDLGLEDWVAKNLHTTGEIDYLNAYLKFRYPLAGRLTLDLTGRGWRRHLSVEREALAGAPVVYMHVKGEEIFHGSTAELNWGDAETNLSAGVEYENNDIWQREPVRRSPDVNFDLSLRRRSGYLNGTYSFGRLTILPGLRLDDTNLFETALSYTLGATVRLTDSTIWRTYYARGYSMPVVANIEVLNGERQLQNIWTVQTGIETSAIPYLWLKASLFYNDIWKIQTFNRSLGGIILRDHIRQGVDLEFRTSPVHGLALTAGYTYTEAWDKETGEVLTSNDVGPRQGLKMGLNYDNSSIGLRGAVTGNYVHWHQPAYPPKDSKVIWDLHLTKELFPGDDLSPALFFSARNIFNSSQYQIHVHPNSPRWFEGGVRYRF